MKFRDLIELAIKNLLRRKGRTLLTVIGVVVGTCAVVVMISLGIATNKSQEEALASWTDLSMIQVYGTGVDANGKQISLDMNAVSSFCGLPHVVAATPYAQSYTMQGYVASAKHDRYQTSGLYNLVGIIPDAMEPMGFKLEEGEWLPEGHITKTSTEIPVLVCEQTAYNFQDTRRSENSDKRYRHYGQTDSAGNQVKPFFEIEKDGLELTLTATDSSSNTKTHTWKLKPVGTLAPDQAKGWWTTNGIVLRLEDLQYLTSFYAGLSGEKVQSSTFDEIYIKVDDINNVEDVCEEIKDLGFSNLYSPTEQRERMQKQVLQSQLMLGGLAAISLLVAALNIANTMNMSIYERTKEIGIMKVLGCTLHAIRTMFLLEAGCIGLLGGITGALLGIGAGAVLNHLTEIFNLFGQSIDIGSLMGSSSSYYGMGMTSTTLSIIPPWLVGAAIAFATGIGLLSGWGPANKAVQISSLEAIRHD